MLWKNHDEKTTERKESVLRGHKARHASSQYGLFCSALGFLLLLNSSLWPAAAAVPGDGRKLPALDKASQGKIVDWMGVKLKEIYVSADTAKAMAELIRRQYQNGHYDKIVDVQEFTQKLTGDLRSVYPDKHLAVAYDPSIRDGDNNLVPATELAARQQAKWREHNFGFKRLEVLDGNVGYLKMDGFAHSLWAREEAVGVMRFLSNCDALIIDLRDNRGGYGSMVKLIMSYFFEEATKISARYIRRTDLTEQAWTTDDVDGRKMSAVGIYVLTSGRTFSAAEAFAFSMKRLQRATLVGERTAGGGRTVEAVSNPEFQITARIPDGEMIGESFEGVGVEPNVKLAQKDALAMAHILALEELAKQASGSKKSYLAWMAEYHRALLLPYKAGADMLKKMAGSYRSLKIQFAGGRLYAIWPDSGARQPLLAMSKNVFVVDGDSDVRLCFQAGKSEIVSVSLVYSDGYQDEIPRNRK